MTKPLCFLLLDEKFIEFYICFYTCQKFILLDVDFYQHKKTGYKNGIKEDNLGGSQPYAVDRRFHLKIQLP